MREAFFQELIKRAKAEKFYFVTADVGFTFKSELEHLLGECFINVGVAERNLIAVASGIASSGHKVFCYSIGPFMTTEALAFIRNEVLYHNVDITLINGGAGLQYGSQGFSHHVYEDINLIGLYPEISIYQPSSESQLNAMFQSIQCESGPKYIRLGWKYNKLGQSRVRLNEEVQEGAGLCIVTSGLILQIVLDEIESFQNDLGLSIQILAVDKICKDFDQEILSKIKAERIIVVEESLFPGPLFSRLYNKIGNHQVLKSVNLELKYYEVGERSQMYERMGFPTQKIKEVIESFK